MHIVGHLRRKAEERGAAWLYVEVGPPHTRDFWAHQGFASAETANPPLDAISLATERCLRFNDTEQFWLRL